MRNFTLQMLTTHAHTHAIAQCIHSGSKNLRNSPLEPPDPGQPSLNLTKPVDDDQKSFVLQVALKCADLGHLSAPKAVHRTCVFYMCVCACVCACLCAASGAQVCGPGAPASTASCSPHVRTWVFYVCVCMCLCACVSVCAPVFVLQVALKRADLGHLPAPQAVHRTSARGCFMCACVCACVRA